MRISPLLPSITEIVCDLGLQDEPFGVTIECNWPTGVQRGREIVVRTFADPSMTPREIDEIVRERVASGLDLYSLDDDALDRCAPDWILSQNHCRVCAVASGDVDAALARLNGDANIQQIEPQNLGEVLASINTIATAASRGEEYGARLCTRLDAVRGSRRKRSPSRVRARMGRPAVGCRSLGARPRTQRRWRAGARSTGATFGINHV